MALVVVGVILLFLYPWAGVIVGAVGVLLVVFFLVGFDRGASPDGPPIKPAKR